MTAVISLALVCLAICSGTAVAQEPTVTIDTGAIIGVSTSIPDANAVVNKFLGIPYASPPRRFDPPQRAKSWFSPLRTQEWKATCIQEYPYPLASHLRAIQIYSNFGIPTGPQTESEDCLYLNVYAPSTPAPSGGRTVMVYIYGGNLQFGNSGMDAYDGSFFAAYEDVIIVSFNFRANAFGFLQSPEQPTGKSNLGFLDQRLALQWVQNNIGKFGGNPAKVTIFGASSGGTSIKQLLAAPPNLLPFRAAIIQSQANNGLLPDSGSAAYNNLIKGTNCNTAASPLDCLRGTPVNLIRSVSENATSFFPAVADNVTSIGNTLDSIRAGRWAKVPLMMGSSLQEGRSLSYIFLFTPTSAINAEGKTLRNFLNGIIPPEEVLFGLTDKIIQAFPGLNPYDLLSQIITDAFFKCTTSKITQTLAENGYDAYRYLFAAEFPNIANVYPGRGVFHSSEVGQVFGTYQKEGSTATQRQLSRYFMKRWAGFAKNPSQGPDPGNWPKVGKNFGRELNVIGRDRSTGGTLDIQGMYDLNCGLYESLLPITGL